MKRFIFLILSCAVIVVFIVGRFAVAKPERAAPPAFSHAVHIEQGLECSACHVGVETSKAGTDNLMPKWSACADCHEHNDLAGKGIALGEPYDGFILKVISDYSPGFGHQRHLSNAKLACTACHNNLDEPISAKQSGRFPTMSECMDCHVTRAVAMECNTCHLPGEKLVPDDHAVMWDQRHGIEAAAANANCSMCHISGSKLDCQSCHQGDAVFNPHPKNYLSRHGHDAHLSDFRCGTCHEQRSFCVDCHAQMNILPADHFRPGFLTATGGRHAEAAEFDLESCMSCHDTPRREPTCVRCHAN